MSLYTYTQHNACILFQKQTVDYIPGHKMMKKYYRGTNTIVIRRVVIFEFTSSYIMLHYPIVAIGR